MSFPEQEISHFSIDSSSFRDPSGFVLTSNNEIYRAISPSYFQNYSFFLNSGLYQSLSSNKLIVKHSEIDFFLPANYSSYKVIKPEQIPFISYPYEWCFSQLKDAALLTLRIQKEALKHEMSLKDASAFNIQFIGKNPVFIDTLSFEKYSEGPWIAYRQFCQHFLSPLALIAYKGESLSKLSQLFLDGIPLALTSSLLTRRSYLNSGIASHIHLHSKIQKNSSKIKNDRKKITLSKKQLLNLLDHLTDTVNDLKLKSKKSQWNNYVSENLYSTDAAEEKSKIISNWLQSVKPSTIWDIGCNTGSYSLLASSYCNQLIALDADHQCIDALYNSLVISKTNAIHPIVVDFANPTPAIGWQNCERKTLVERGKPDLSMALALIHHLRITHSIPFEKIAHSFSQLGEWLIIEYVPKEDKQVQEMLMNREDTFEDFTASSFLSCFKIFFTIEESVQLSYTGRVLYLMRRK